MPNFIIRHAKLMEAVYRYLNGEISREEFEALCRKYGASAKAVLKLFPKLRGKD